VEVFFNAAVENLLLNEPPANVTIQARYNASTESLQITEPPATVQTGAVIQVPVENIILSQPVPNIRAGSFHIASVESLFINEPLAIGKAGAKFVAAVESLLLSELPVIPRGGSVAAIPVESLVITEVVPTVKTGAKFQAPTEIINFNEQGFGVRTGNDITVNIPVETLQLTQPLTIAKINTRFSAPVEVLNISEPPAVVKAGAKVIVFREGMAINECPITVVHTQTVAAVPCQLITFNEPAVVIKITPPKKFGMNKEVAAILKEKLRGLPFVDRLAGIAQTVTETQAGEISGTITKRYPVTYDPNELDENGNVREICLVPDQFYKSIIYFEDGGIDITQDARHGNGYRSALRLVCWLNRAKLVGSHYTEISGRCINAIISRLTNKNPETVGMFIKFKTNVSRIPPQDNGIFSRYTYSETDRQYLRPPFDFFAIDFIIDFQVKEKCIDDIPWNIEVCA
jgi:hypothetical protein